MLTPPIAPACIALAQDSQGSKFSLCTWDHTPTLADRVKVTMDWLSLRGFQVPPETVSSAWEHGVPFQVAPKRSITLTLYRLQPVAYQPRLAAV